MKINQSAVAMSSSRQYSRVRGSTASVIFKQEPAQPEKKDMAGDRVSISDESRQLMRNLKQMKEDARDQSVQKGQSAGREPWDNKSQEEVMLETLKRILEMLKDLKRGRNMDMGSLNQELKNLHSMRTQGNRKNQPDNSFQAGKTPVSGNGIWTRQIVTSSFMKETEHTAFTSVGAVRTSDGREIQFNITMEMSRSYEEAHSTFWEQKDVMYKDPLIINLDTGAASISDQKFLFDLDADGKEESISYLGKGSGFLSLDKNNDGIINDGSELFGTQSGDGFADLAKYDEDGNGWIDENDSVFGQLRIWTKNEDGTDRLIGIGEAGVGAIYLGEASTEFSLNSEKNNSVNGAVRSTGVYLKENGEAGTIQHVDFAI